MIQQQGQHLGPIFSLDDSVILQNSSGLRRYGHLAARLTPNWSIGSLPLVDFGQILNPWSVLLMELAFPILVDDFEQSIEEQGSVLSRYVRFDCRADPIKVQRQQLPRNVIRLFVGGVDPIFLKEPSRHRARDDCR